MYYNSGSRDFQGENLQGKNFEALYFENDLLENDLENAQFQGADLKYANFQGANLRGAQFQGADLKDANFKLADIHEANFRGAKLQGANFKDCEVFEANWLRAEYNDKTQFPARFDPDDYRLIKRNRRGQSASEESGEPSIDEPDTKIRNAVIKIGKSLQKRQGQRKFRENLIKAYKGCCAITGCKIEGVLEAAHIKPYCRSGDNKIKNGILLRADLHTLFDLNLIVIHPYTKRIEIKESLQDSEYKQFNGTILQSYQKNIYLPDYYYLEWRYQNYEKHINQFLIAYPQ